MKKARNLLTHPKAKSAAIAMALMLIWSAVMMTSCDKKCYDPKDPKCENYVPPVIDDTIPDNPVDTTPDNPVDTTPDDPVEPQKQDVRIGWSLNSKDAGNLCDGKLTGYGKVLTGEIVDSLKNLPTTGNISAYVYCDDGRGPPQISVQNMITRLILVRDKGVIFEPDTLYIYDNSFTIVDSTNAQQELNLTLDMWSRRAIKSR